MNAPRTKSPIRAATVRKRSIKYGFHAPVNLGLQRCSLEPDSAGALRNARASRFVRFLTGAALFVALWCVLPTVARGAEGPSAAQTSIVDNAIAWPTWGELIHVLALRDHNTRMVVLGTALLGMAAGVIGTFAYLRRRALMGDALSHATLPGIALVFLIVGEKHLGQLLLGAAATGVLGVLCVLGIRATSRIKEDAAIGIVLSVFFAAGMALFSIVQKMNTGNQAGLLSFIYGKTAALVLADAQRTAVVAGVVILGAVLLFKEFRVVCFDRAFAASQGIPSIVVDLLMMGLVVMTTVVGLQAVGLIMIVALLIIPPAAARFWTDDLTRMTILAGAFGVFSGWSGSMVSALLPRMPAGALIVICAGFVFLISMIAAPRRGLLASVWRQLRLRRRVADQNLMRAFAEMMERGDGERVPLAGLLAKRSWSRSELTWSLRRARRALRLTGDERSGFKLTTPGHRAARQVLRNHRLWEMYLIRYADIAPSHVDRDADEIEHVLGDAVVAELEQALAEQGRIPVSPHVVQGGPEMPGGTEAPA